MCIYTDTSSMLPKEYKRIVSRIFAFNNKMIVPSGFVYECIVRKVTTKHKEKKRKTKDKVQVGVN